MYVASSSFDVVGGGGDSGVLGNELFVDRLVVSIFDSKGVAKLTPSSSPDSPTYCAVCDPCGVELRASPSSVVDSPRAVLGCSEALDKPIWCSPILELFVVDIKSRPEGKVTGNLLCS